MPLGIIISSFVQFQDDNEENHYTLTAIGFMFLAISAILQSIEVTLEDRVF